MSELLKNAFWYIIREMCYEKMLPAWYTFFIPDQYKTQAMCIETVEESAYLSLRHVPDHFKTQEMCDKAMHRRPCVLKYVPDYFVTREWVDMWYDDDKYCTDDNGYIKWYNGYQKRKTQKAKIKDELMAISWHPSRWWDCRMSEDEKKETEKLWA